MFQDLVVMKLVSIMNWKIKKITQSIRGDQPLELEMDNRVLDLISTCFIHNSYVHKYQ